MVYVCGNNDDNDDIQIRLFSVILFFLLMPFRIIETRTRTLTQNIYGFKFIM